jgi:hypothetical protein
MDADVSNVPENLQMEVIELQAYLVLKSQFNNIALRIFINFIWWKRNIQIYVHFQEKSFVFSDCTYMCEQFFSRMKYNK